MTEYRNWIGGEWVTGDGVSVNLNPSDLDGVIGEYSRASQVQVDAASRQRQGRVARRRDHASVRSISMCPSGAANSQATVPASSVAMR